MTVRFETAIEILGIDAEVWVEAEVTVSDGKPIYSDAMGDFGPPECEFQIDTVAVWLASGIEVYDSLTARLQTKIDYEIEDRVISR